MTEQTPSIPALAEEHVVAEPPYTLSAPPPAQMTSLPPRPTMSSLPFNPLITSAPAVPVNSSGPSVPTIVVTRPLQSTAEPSNEPMSHAGPRGRGLPR